VAPTKGTAVGLADRLNELKTKAQDTVAEHSDQLHDAVGKAAAAADQHTGGRYSERIQKAGTKAGELVDSLKPTDESAGTEGEERSSSE
jgi:ABC-type transporter Mla subunit MlaD